MSKLLFTLLSSCLAKKSSQEQRSWNSRGPYSITEKVELGNVSLSTGIYINILNGSLRSVDSVLENCAIIGNSSARMFTSLKVVLPFSKKRRLKQDANKF